MPDISEPTFISAWCRQRMARPLQVIDATSKATSHPFQSFFESIGPGFHKEHSVMENDQGRNASAIPSSESLRVAESCIAGRTWRSRASEFSVHHVGLQRRVWGWKRVHINLRNTLSTRRAMSRSRQSKDCSMPYALNYVPFQNRSESSPLPLQIKAPSKTSRGFIKHCIKLAKGYPTLKVQKNIYVWL